jgi:hypothetical protein
MSGLFETYSKATLQEAISVQEERGAQYGDTWLNCQFLILKSVFKRGGLQTPTQDECRAIASAVLCDMKYQRFEGGYKEDNIDDGINYQAFLKQAMRKLNTNESK